MAFIQVSFMSKTLMRTVPLQYLPWEEKQRMLRELQKYTVGISEVQKERLNNAIYQISDEEILALSEGYYSNEVGVLEEPQMNFENY